MNKKLKSKIEHQIRQRKFDVRKDFYNHRIGSTMTMIPLFLEYFEDLNEVIPEFYTMDVLKKLEQFSNSLYYKQSSVDLVDVADEQISNVEQLRKFFEENLNKSSVMN
jgi:hypothetical protein